MQLNCGIISKELSKRWSCDIIMLLVQYVLPGKYSVAVSTRLIGSTKAITRLKLSGKDNKNKGG